MNLKKSTSVDTYTAFVFGKEGSGYDHLALQMAAERGNVLVVACSAVDGLIGKSVIDRKELPPFAYVEIASVDDFDDVLAELNKDRAVGEEYSSIVFFGLAQYTFFVAQHLFPDIQLSLPQYGLIAREVVNAIRSIRGYAKSLFVTCDIRPAEDGSDRLNVQPAIENAIAGELAHAFFVSAKKDGTRLVQTDPLLALNFISGGAKEAGAEDTTTDKVSRRAGREARKEADNAGQTEKQ